MIKINLRDYYPHYTSDCLTDVPDEIAELLHEFRLREAAYYLRRYRNKAFYSLDRGDGIENHILFVSLSPSEIYEHRMTTKQLHATIASLPDKQAKRIYAHFFLGMSKASIAEAEGISEKAVRSSINRALRNLKKILKNLDLVGSVLPEK